MTGGAWGNDDGVSDSDFLREATAELYGSDPEEFTERRTALASRARAAGDRSAAKEIAGLRKPTRSAWMINQLVRADPGVADRLAGLGDELRAAAAALDGAKIRELSQERRKLVDTLIRRTLQQAGEQSPSAAVREDLTATFGAALADPQVARDLADGTLVRAAHHADFGTGAPELTLVPPPVDAAGTTPSSGRGASRTAGASRTPGASRSAGVSRGQGPRSTRTTTPAGTGEEASAADEARAARAAERAKAAEEARAAEEDRAARAARAAEDRQRAIAEAEQTLEEASREADQAAQDEQDARDNIQALESQLDEAHRRVTEARRKARDTQSALQKARRAVARLTPARRDRG